MRITVGHLLILLLLGFLTFRFWGTVPVVQVVGRETKGLYEDAKSFFNFSKEPEVPSNENETKPPVVVTDLPPAPTVEKVVVSTAVAVPIVAAAPVSTVPVTSVLPAGPVAAVKSTPLKKARTKQSVSSKKRQRVQQPGEVYLAIARKSTAGAAVPASAARSEDNDLDPATVSQSSMKGAENKSDMVGTYVSLELNSGRRIQGVLEGETDTEYKIQLPGMGPFSYPKDTVESIIPVR